MPATQYEWETLQYKLDFIRKLYLARDLLQSRLKHYQIPLNQWVNSRDKRSTQKFNFKDSNTVEIELTHHREIMSDGEGEGFQNKHWSAVFTQNEISITYNNSEWDRGTNLDTETTLFIKIDKNNKIIESNDFDNESLSSFVAQIEIHSHDALRRTVPRYEEAKETEIAVLKNGMDEIGKKIEAMIKLSKSPHATFPAPTTAVTIDDSSNKNSLTTPAPVDTDGGWVLVTSNNR